MAKAAVKARATEITQREMRVADLRPNGLNPRSMDSDCVVSDEFISSIRESGILQPLLVTPEGVVIAGHRRLVAARALGIESVPVLVRDMDEVEQITAMLTENLQRDDLSPLAVANTYHELIDRGLSIEEIAKRTGCSAGTVSLYVDLLKLPSDLFEAIDAGELPIGAARHLLRLPTEKAQLRIGAQAVEHGWLVREVKDAVDRELARESAPPPARPRIAPMDSPPWEAKKAPVQNTPPRESQPQAVAPRTAQRVVDLLIELTRTVRNAPKVAADPSVESWIKEFAAAVKVARG